MFSERALNMRSRRLDARAMPLQAVKRNHRHHRVCTRRASRASNKIPPMPPDNHAVFSSSDRAGRSAHAAEYCRQFAAHWSGLPGMQFSPGSPPQMGWLAALLKGGTLPGAIRDSALPREDGGRVMLDLEPAAHRQCRDTSGSVRRTYAETMAILEDVRAHGRRDAGLNAARCGIPRQGF